MKNKIILFIITIFLISCSKENNNLPGTQKNQKRAMLVDVIVVSESDFSNSLSTVGSFLANEEIDVKSPINGNILKINFTEGKNVNKGQLIVQLDSREWKSQLTSSEINLKNLKKEYERKNELYKIHGISLEELEKTENAIANEEAAIELLKVKIDYAEIKAPFSGKMGLREVSPGSYLLQGQSIAKLVSTNPIKVEFSVPAEYANQLQVGSSVNVISKSNFDTLVSKIYAMEPSIDQNTRNIKIRAQSPNPASKYLPGDFVEILIKLKEMKSVILIPNQAIVPKINEQTVYVVKNGIAQETVVLTGVRNDKSVQILSGLNLGDTIMVTGLVNIRNNTPVEISKVLK